MKTITTAMDTHISGVVTSLCTCWKITRTDGLVLGFTDHDREIVIDDVVYKASTGYYRSAIANSADSSVDNLDVSGFLDDSSLNETELRNGAYDYAEVEVFAVNWRDLTQGIIRLRYGLFGEVMIASSGFFKVELRGLTQLFSQTIVETYSPECRADLGDHRCKVPLVPPTRSAVHAYQVGDRILVPIPEGVSTNIDVLNPGFELRPAPHNWEVNSGTVLNTNQLGQLIENPYAEQDKYRLVAKSATGNISFKRDIDFFGSTDHPNFQTNITVLEGGEGVQFRVTQYWAKGDTVFGDPEVLLDPPVEETSGWVTLSTAGDHVITLPEMLEAGAPYLAMEEALHVRYRIEWQDAVPDLVYFAGYPMIETTVVNKALLAPSGLAVTTMYDWTLSPSARYTGPTVWMSPFEGAWNLELFPMSEGTEFAYQDVPLTSLSAFFEEIDEGTMVIQVDAAAGAATMGVQNFVSLVFYNEADAVIGTAVEEAQDTHGKGFWGPHFFKADLPPLTRKVRVQLNTHNPTMNARSRGVWDNINVRIFQESYETQGNYLGYGGVEFVCTQAGISDIAVPAYNYSIGAVTVDGSAQFTASTPLHMFVDEIVEVTSNKQFKITSTIDKEDSWFEWGVLEILSGPNVKKKMEIAKWDNATKTITLALGLPYIPLVGDKLRMHTGCGKTRAICTSKFNNMNNYRGEPDIPGTDQYFKIGAANTGGSAPPGSTSKF